MCCGGGGVLRLCISVIVSVCLFTDVSDRHAQFHHTLYQMNALPPPSPSLH